MDRQYESKNGKASVGRSSLLCSSERIREYRWICKHSLDGGCRSLKAIQAPLSSFQEAEEYYHSSLVEHFWFEQTPIVHSSLTTCRHYQSETMESQGSVVEYDMQSILHARLDRRCVANKDIQMVLWQFYQGGCIEKKRKRKAKKVYNTLGISP
jgi:hypothetical protein